jgi:hypothetical protein
MNVVSHEQERGRSSPAVLEYRSVAADRVDGREHFVGALRNVALLAGMLVCVTAFLFLALGGLALMVVAVSGWGWFGAGVFCMSLAMVALFLAGWCLDSMR